MKYIYRSTILLLFFMVFLASSVSASTSVNLSSSDNWNLRYDGLFASDYLGNYQMSYGDVNNDSKDDLIISEYYGTYSGRDGTITYVIYSTLLESITGKGNTIDLSNSSNYNLKIVPALDEDYQSYYAVSVAKINSGDNNDLVISHGYGSHGGVSYRGVVYVLYDSLLSTYSGTGNVIDLSSTSNFNIKLLGAGASHYFGYSYSTAFDLNSDSRKDLVISADSADYNSRNDSGSTYVIYSTLLDSYGITTGNVLSMATSTNYNVRYDGPVASNLLESFVVSDSNLDLTNDGKDDLVIFNPSADYNGSNSGSMFIISNTLVDDYVGTGNTVDLATTSKYTVRYDSTSGSNGSLGYSITTTGDTDGDGQTDLLIGNTSADNNSRTNSGSVYIINGSLLDNYVGTGNTASLSNSSSYNTRIDGASSSDGLGYDMILIDINGDGRDDMVTDTVKNRVYIVDSSKYWSNTSTGNSIDLSNTSNYSIVYNIINSTGAVSPFMRLDLNNDGKKDIFITDSQTDYNSLTNSGSVYVIYNYPHSISKVSEVRSGSTVTISGTISATSSTTTISGVQYQIDNNNPLSGWTDCTADDGTFNSTSENYTCFSSSAPVTDGTHTVYLRSFDTNMSYTAQSHYGTYVYSIGSGSTTSMSSDTQTSASEVRPQISQLTGGDNNAGIFSPTNDSNTGDQKVITIIEPNTFNFDAYFFSQKSEPTVKSLLPNPVTGENPKINVKSNTVLAGISKIGVRKSGKVMWQVGNIQKIWYKTSPASSSVEAAIIIPELQRRPSIIGLSYQKSDLVPLGKPNSKFNERGLKLAHSIDGVAWKILPTSVVDTANMTVAALHRIGGYYMVVGGY